MCIYPAVHFRGVKLHMDSAQTSVFAVRGANVTLPCRFWYEPELSSPRKVRVKWYWLPAAGGHETDVLVAFGSHSRNFGVFRLFKWQILMSHHYLFAMAGWPCELWSVGQGSHRAQTWFPRRCCPCDDWPSAGRHRPVSMWGGGWTGRQEHSSSSGVTRYSTTTRYFDSLR